MQAEADDRAIESSRAEERSASSFSAPIAVTSGRRVRSLTTFIDKGAVTDRIPIITATKV